MEEKVAAGPFEIKSEFLGQVSAVFATFGVVDKDGDVTFPGAFEDGAEVPVSSYGHAVWSGGVPVGLGRIRATTKEAILDAQFFMDTTAGRDTFALIKNMGPRQEYSYGYDVLNPREMVVVGGAKANALRRLRVHEVSPVWKGAGVGTRTLAAKAADDPAREEALHEYARFLRMKVADLRQRAADLQRAEALAIRDERDRLDVAEIRAALL